MTHVIGRNYIKITINIDSKSPSYLKKSKWCNDVSDLKLHEHITCIATGNWNLLIIKGLRTFLVNDGTIKSSKVLRKIITLNRSQESYNVKFFKEIKRLKKKAEVYLESNQASTTEIFLWIYFMFYYTCNISSNIDIRLGYIWASENMN